MRNGTEFISRSTEWYGFFLTTKVRDGIVWNFNQTRWYGMEWYGTEWYGFQNLCKCQH
jgi:hypothetical protein